MRSPCWKNMLPSPSFTIKHLKEERKALRELHKFDSRTILTAEKELLFWSWIMGTKLQVHRTPEWPECIKNVEMTQGTSTIRPSELFLNKNGRKAYGFQYYVSLGTWAPHVCIRISSAPISWQQSTCKIYDLPKVWKAYILMHTIVSACVQPPMN